MFFIIQQYLSLKFDRITDKIIRLLEVGGDFMTYKYTEDDYCDLFSKKICDNCGKCLEEDGIDIRAINIEDISKTVEENAFIEEELKNALEALKEEESSENIEEEELTLENYNDILNNLDDNSDYVDAFDNIVYFDELGVDNDIDLEDLTEEIYPGIRKLKKN